MKWFCAITFLALTSSGALGQGLATETFVGNLEVVGTFTDAMPTGVTVANDKRIFLNFPRWGDQVEATVAEFKNGKTVPYPSAEMNDYKPGASAGDHLISVQSVVVDPASKYLWILDTGSIAFGPVVDGGAKLVGIDLETNRVAKKIVFAPDVVLKTSYANDVRFALHRGTEGMAFITDSSANGPNGIIVVDLASGKSWRRLNDHPSTKPDPAFVPMVEGEILAVRQPGALLTKFEGGADGIAISADGRTLFYCPLSSRHLYAVSVDALADPDVSDADVAKTVLDLGEKGGASDGLESDEEGRLYLSDYEHNAIHRRKADGDMETLVHDPRVLWPDTLSLARDGYLYFTANQLERQPRFHKGVDLRKKPYVLFRVNVHGSRIQ